MTTGFGSRVSNKIGITTAVLTVAFLSVFASLYVLNPSGLEQRRVYIDIHTGRHKVVRQLLFLTTAEETNETTFSKLWLSFHGSYPVPEWENEMTLSWFNRGRSPNYGYLGANRWREWIVDAVETRVFDTCTQQAVVAAFVKHLESGVPSSARDYAADVLTLANECSQCGRILSNVPAWLTNGTSAPK